MPSIRPAKFIPGMGAGALWSTGERRKGHGSLLKLENLGLFHSHLRRGRKGLSYEKGTHHSAKEKKSRCNRESDNDGLAAGSSPQRNFLLW